MRYLVSCFALVGASALALSAIAQPPEKDGKKGDNNKRAEMRERMLKEFDANKDGKLDDAERAKAKEKMREMRAARGSGKAGKVKGGPAGAAGRKGRGGPHPPNPAEMFEKFDKDKDGKLSKDEFMEMAKAVREHMQRLGGPGRPDGARSEGRRPRGPSGSARSDGRRPPGPSMGSRYEGWDYAGGYGDGGYDRGRFDGPRPWRGYERDRYAGRRGPEGKDFEGDRYAGPPRGYRMRRERERFAGPPERYRYDGPRPPRPPRPPFDRRLADGRFDGPPEETVLTIGAAEIETKWARHSVTAKNAGAGAGMVVPKTVPQIAKKALEPSAPNADALVMVRRAKATKPGDVVGPMVLRVATVRLRTMAHEANIDRKLTARHIRPVPAAINPIRQARRRNQKRAKTTQSPPPFDLSS